MAIPAGSPGFLSTGFTADSHGRGGVLHERPTEDTTGASRHTFIGHHLLPMLSCPTSQECFHAAFHFCVFDVHICHALLAKEMVDDPDEVRIDVFFRGVVLHG